MVSSEDFAKCIFHSGDVYGNSTDKILLMDDYRTPIYQTYASGFQGVGPDFDKGAARRWGRAYDYYFRGWFPKDKDSAIVDLACGSGKLLYYFKQHGFANLSGIDISPEQVRLAQQVLPGALEGNVLDFIQGKQEKFDLITAIDIIEHLRKEETLLFLDRCYAALKYGGRLIVQTPNASSPWVSALRYGDFTHEVCFTPTLLRKLMHHSGFLNVEIREQCPVPWRYSLFSTFRHASWKLLRLSLKFWNIIETGGGGDDILTRVFLISGVKQ